MEGAYEVGEAECNAMKLLAFPFKVIGLAILFIAYILTAHSLRDTFGDWLEREIF